MSTYIMDGQLDMAAPPQGDRDTRLLLVVGFDGSPPAARALQSAAQHLSGRSGLLEVVYVAQMPAGAAFSAGAVSATQEALDQEETELRARASSVLEGTGLPWHFQRRDGAVAHELLTVAEELAASSGPDSQVAIVLGGSAQRIHRYLHSVSQHLLRRDRFSIVVVP
jgi:nucleotide-binding universal stress UspA family protein